MRIAFVGTGVMGAPMVRHLAAQGHELLLYNRSPEKAQALADCARVAGSLAEAVVGAEAIMTIVGFVRDVEEVYFAPAGILESASPGSIVCDLTTSSPELARRIAEAASQRGLRALDAPVTGGDRGAREGRLSMMVGGDLEAFKKMEPIFAAFCARINYMGEAGQGQHTKLANQICIAGALGGVAEALAYAEAQGLDTQQVLDVICHGSAASWQAENNGPKMLTADMAPGFYLKHFLKDIRLGQEGAREGQYPLTQALKLILEELVERGYGNLGTQALIKHYRED